jgi:hypothetical protein
VLEGASKEVQSSETWTKVNYALSHEDVGHRTRCRATASDNSAEASVIGVGTILIVSAKPVKVAASLISGFAKEGEEFIVSEGVWDGADLTPIYQWLSCLGSGESCVASNGATQKTHKTAT